MATATSYFHNTTVRLAIVVILLVLVSAASMLALLYQSTLASARDALALQQQTNANYIHNQMAFYQEVVDQLARRTRVKDLLNVGHGDESMAWAMEMQNQLPNSIGLALVRPGVELLGDSPMQRVGPSCVADMEHLELGQPVPMPPVHLDNPRLAHFDLTAEVHGYDGEIIGTVFASFSLEILQNTIESLTRPGQVQRIRDGRGRLLVQAGKPDPGAMLLEHTQPIPHTDWVLETRGSLGQDHHPSQQPLVIATLVITAVLVVVVSGFTWRSLHHDTP